MHRHGHGFAMRLCGRRGRIAGCAAAFDGRHVPTSRNAAARRLRETVRGLAGHDGTGLLSLIEADAVVATEAVRGAGEASPAWEVERRHKPRRHRRRTRGRRATVARHTGAAAGDGRATASKGLVQQCGFASSSSKDGGSPSKTNRLTPARLADAVPGAAASLVSPPKNPEAQWASVRRAALRTVSRLADWYTRDRRPGSRTGV